MPLHSRRTDGVTANGLVTSNETRATAPALTYCCAGVMEPGTTSGTVSSLSAATQRPMFALQTKGAGQSELASQVIVTLVGTFRSRLHAVRPSAIHEAAASRFIETSFRVESCSSRER